MKKRNINVLFVLLALLLMSSCHFFSRTDKGMSGNEEEDFMLIRYDRLLTEYLQFNSLSALQKMSTNYLPITKVLFEDVLALGTFDDVSIPIKLREYYSDPTLVQLLNDVSNKFPDLTKLEKELAKGFKELEKNIEGLKIPKVYTQISALNESIIVTDSLLGVSLDKYMGQDYPLYQRYYYDYQTRMMDPKQMLSDIFVFYLVSEYPLTLYGATLLDVMVYYGRIYYVVDELLTNQKFEDMLGYTEEETKWCNENKASLWNFMLRNRLLESTDPMLIREYIRPIPSGSYRGESPLLLGIWMGYQITKEYVKKNKNITWKELLEIENNVYFLEQSKFNPE